MSTNWREKLLIRNINLKIENLKEKWLVWLKLIVYSSFEKSLEVWEREIKNILEIFCEIQF